MADMTVGRVIPAVNSGNYPLTEKVLDKQKIVRCKDCKHRDPEDRKCDCGGMPFDTQIFPVPDDWFCPYGERKGGDPNG